jgi:diguanylate cyclase (GGDEF)-like protein/PAS domain S-box-containing protein
MDTLSSPHPASSPLLEQLRLQAQRIDELERKIDLLQRRHHEDVEQVRQGFVTEISHYRDIKREWTWFFDHALDMMCIFHLDGTIKRVNNAFAAMIGYEPDDLMNRNIQDLSHPDDLGSVADVLRELGTGIDTINYESRLVHKDGTVLWISWTCPGCASDNHTLYSIGRDITAHKANESELLFKAQHDPLTGLANRSIFEQSLQRAIARSARLPSHQVAVLLIDLDGFKPINDQYGHVVGDQVLKITALRFMEMQRKSDLVCRMGGDEFSWIVEGPAPLSPEPLAERIVEVIREPIVLDGLVVTVGCSVGIAVYPDDCDTSDALYCLADEAMYSIKRNGKNGFARKAC